eukprot:365245-Chlamydomonas_euryale.AAC.4
MPAMARSVRLVATASAVLYVVVRLLVIDAAAADWYRALQEVGWACGIGAWRECWSWVRAEEIRGEDVAMHELAIFMPGTPAFSLSWPKCFRRPRRSHASPAFSTLPRLVFGNVFHCAHAFPGSVVRQPGWSGSSTDRSGLCAPIDLCQEQWNRDNGNGIRVVGLG